MKINAQLFSVFVKEPYYSVQTVELSDLVSGKGMEL